MYSIQDLDENTPQSEAEKPEKFDTIIKMKLALCKASVQITLYSNSDSVGENGRGHSENCILDVTIVKISTGGLSRSRISKGQLCVSKGNLVKVIGHVIVTSMTTVC